MIRGQKSSYNNIENFLCPFTDMFITQGAMEGGHKGIMAVDVRGYNKGVRYSYYAPCTVKCLKVYPVSGQAMWQSVSNVRCANGYIGIVTFMTVHDDSFNARVGDIYPQGSRLGNMGMKGNANGVHCHIEISQSCDSTWSMNRYGIYHFNREVDIDDACFFDNTNILNRKMFLKPKYTSSLNQNKYVNLSSNIVSWAIYNIGDKPLKKNAIGFLKPSKFGGLSYRIYEFLDSNCCVSILTRDYGKVKIYIYNTNSTITDKPIYDHGSY